MSIILLRASGATTRCRSKGGPEVNKFEEVSSDDHQMSVVEAARAGDRGRIPGLISRGQGQGQDWRGGGCVVRSMDNGDMGPLWTDSITDGHD